MSETNSKRSEKNNNPVSENLLYDTPLLDPDEDRLGRKEFARFLAQAILKMNADEGFVFALNGPWGSGKTTVINFVLHFIEKTDKSETPLVVVRFNPWWFSGREQLLHQFFTQFRAALGEADVSDDLQKVGNKLDLFANILAPLTLVPTVGQPAGILRKVLQSIGVSTKAAAEILNKDVHKLRVTIDSLLRKQHSRILVVIDDIDRLPAEEIRQLFQVVKAVADFPKTIYLLAFDRRVVSDALDTLQSSSGESYVEKIVQCPFDLPSSDQVSLRRLLFEQIDEIMKGTPEELIDKVEFGNLYWDGIDPFIKTPRDVKRYINILRPTYPILIGDVRSVDFLGIQALRLFAPEMYHFVATNKEGIAGTDDYLGGTRDRTEERRKWFDLILEAVTEDKRQAVKGIMGRLFPRWASVYGGVSYGSDWLSQWRKEKRICSPDMFDRYFRLAIPLGDISAAEMRAILDLAGDADAFGAELIRLANEHRPDTTTRLRIFLELMEDYIQEDIPAHHFESILKAFFTVGDQLIKEEDSQGMFIFGNDTRMVRISYQLLKRLPSQQERFEMLRRVFAETKALGLMSGFLVSLGQEHGKYTDSKPRESEDKRIIGSDHVSKLEALALEKIRDVAKQKLLHNFPEFGHLLYHLSDLGSEEEAQDYVADLIENDEGLCDYLVGFLSTTYSHGLEDRVQRKNWRIRLESIKKFSTINLEKLLDRCREILRQSPEWMDDRRRLALNIFIDEMTNPKDEWGRQKKD